jgi:AcrR family transcriptional regulator
MDSNEADTFEGILWRFSKKVIEALQDLVESERMIRTTDFRERFVVTSFEYNEGNISYEGRYDNIKRDVYQLVDFFQFIDSDVKEIPEYSNLVTLISKLYNRSMNSANSVLRRYVHVFTSKVIESIDNRDEEFITRQIVIFIQDLENGRIEWNTTAWLRGLWLEEEEYELEKGIKIRRLNPTDLEYERPLELYESFVYPQHLPPTILEMDIMASSAREVQEKIEEIVNVLKLYKIGSIELTRTDMETESYLRVGGIFSGHSGGGGYIYSIGSEDLEQLRQFFQLMKPIVPNRLLSYVKSPERFRFSVAFERFSESLTERIPLEGRIAHAVACLEALFLSEVRESEISRTLAQRVAALLSHLGLNGVEIFQKMLIAYGIRSCYVQKRIWMQSVGRLLIMLGWH